MPATTVVADAVTVGVAPAITFDSEVCIAPAPPASVEFVLNARENIVPAIFKERKEKNLDFSQSPS
jgi:hypothetical protein